MTRVDLVVIGTSLGGIDALAQVLGALPAAFPLPIAIVVHRSSDTAGDAMSVLLQTSSRLPVCEVEDKDAIVPGRVYVAPPDYHLLVDDQRFALSVDARVCWARPSIDVLFESAADVFRERLLAVVLTGASRDGAEGVRRVKRRGGTVVVQEPEEAESKVMPRAAIAAGPVDRVLRLHDIARYLDTCAHTRSTIDTSPRR